MDLNELTEKLKEISAMTEDREDVMEKLKYISDNWPKDEYKQKYEDLQKKYRDRFFTNYNDEEISEDRDGIIDTTPEESGNTEDESYEIFKKDGE